MGFFLRQASMGFFLRQASMNPMRKHGIFSDKHESFGTNMIFWLGSLILYLLTAEAAIQDID